ncbi:RidA family protein [Alkalihalobacillus oceani]|uniref:RidA family protein n=1 Tax=Halalkalibacter oceani TaxID=1653776 RepID=UPI00203C0938|nr:RidA family protein [Halalkalibacter oceani]MCM3760440.1 RidA family protein [Halalkalibacter oceani]
MNYEKKLADLNIQLPTLAKSNLPFANGVIVDNLLYLSGQTPMVDGEMKYLGTVGSTISIEEAEEAARICTLNLLAVMKEMLGNLERVKRVVKMNGYVASLPDFTEQPRVINAASNLLNDIFGEDKPHARAALGVASLPGGTSVEIEMVVEITA